MRLSKYPAIYIQIPKTGAGSISSIVEQSGGHRAASWIRKSISNEEWVSRFRFALVRHPYDRFRSTLAHFGVNAPAKEILADPWQFNIPPIVLFPQSWYLDEKLDYIGDFHQIEKEWEFISSVIGAKEPLPRNNQSKNKPPLTREDTLYLWFHYKDDFRQFGFSTSFVNDGVLGVDYPIYAEGRLSSSVY